jgi:hypothetical protein
MTRELATASISRLLAPFGALAVCAVGSWYAYAEIADRALWGALAGIFIALAANGLVLVAAGRRLANVRFSEPIRATVGGEFKIRLPAWILWQPLVQVQIEWLRPACQAVLRDGGEVLTFARRLKANSIRRRITLKDWCGLWTWHFEVTTDLDVIVSPSVVPPVGRPPKLHNVRGEGDDAEGSGEGDLLEFRSYQEGDSSNRIMWKMFTRTGKLFVRKPEKAGSPLVGIFLVCSSTDEPAAELAWYVTDKTLPRSQDFFGEGWVFGTSADFAEVEENQSAAIHSADWQATRESILNSGRETGSSNSAETVKALQAFMKCAGSGLSSVAVLLGDEVPRVETWGIEGCQFFKISRGGNGVEWELIYPK